MKQLNLPHPKKILIASFEAGGAQIVSSYVRSNRDHNYDYYLAGPAISIFNKKLESIKLINGDINYSLYEYIICGSSWMPSFERDIIKTAKKYGVQTITFLDHWINFRERFLPISFWKKIPNNWLDYLPDKVCVGDKYACDLAKKVGVPEEKLYYYENPYLSDIKKVLINKKKKEANKFEILYISEPVFDDCMLTYGDSNYWGYTEFSILDELSNLVNECKKISIKIRLHPNEKKDKYNKYINDNIYYSKNDDLIDDLMDVKIVLGHESMALAIALMGDLKVVSYIPRNSKKICSLPHDELIHISSIKQIKEIVGVL